MSDSTKEFVKPGAEANIHSVHPEASGYVETAGEMAHLKRIHSELADTGAEATGPLTPVPEEPKIDSLQFEINPSAASNSSNVVPIRKQTTNASLDSTTWGHVQMAKKLKEISARRKQKGELEHAA